MDNPNSKIERVKLRGRETTTHLLTVDDLIAYQTPEGGLVLEFVRWDASKQPAESYRLTLCSEDAARVRSAK